MNPDDLKSKGYIEFAPGEWRKPVRASAGSQVSDAKPQCQPRAALVTPAPREAKSLQRITVRFIGRRVRPLDPDNFAGSVKDLLDGLRHAGLIPGDEPWQIRLETEQERVKHFKDEMTVIEIMNTTLESTPIPEPQEGEKEI